MTPIAFFNNKGGVGKTALVSHLAWMFAERGVRTLAVDLDPQSNLTSMFVTEDRIQELWEQKLTIYAAVRPLMERSGDLAPVHLEPIAPSLHLLAGDLSLSRFEDLLAENWAKCLTGEVGAFRVISAFHRMMADAADRVGASIILIDLGPNLGPLNRAALLAADKLVLPIAPDLFSLQGLQNLGPTLRDWRKGWTKRVEALQDTSLAVPKGQMEPMGYVIMSFGVRDDRPVKAYDAWIARVPRVYREVVLDKNDPNIPNPEHDPFRLATLRHYHGLLPLAMTARKPMFLLKPADGARGAHLEAVQACYRDFLKLARDIGAKLGVSVDPG